MVEKAGIDGTSDEGQRVGATWEEIQPLICNNNGMADPIETDGRPQDAVPPVSSPAVSFGASASVFLRSFEDVATGPHDDSGTMSPEHALVRDEQLDEALKALASFTTAPSKTDPWQSAAASHRNVVVNVEECEVIEEGGDISMPAHVDSQLAAVRRKSRAVARQQQH